MTFFWRKHVDPQGNLTFDKRSKSQNVMYKKDTFLCGKATTTIPTLSELYVFLMQG